MKSARHQAILDLIEQHPIDRQEDLLAHLREEGFDVTQATVSRDIRELQLVKTATADGRYRYVPASASGKVTHSPSRFEMIFRESVLKVDYAGHMVLVKCFSGMANAACEVFDAKQWDNVVGTLSGDDTFFILMRSEDDAAAICKQLQQYTTAYSFSAGGPILDAAADVLVLTPVCAHNVHAAPLVFAADRHLKIIADAENRDGSFVCADSSAQCDLLPGESLLVTGCGQRLRLIAFDDAEQFHAIENKLMRR